MKTCKVLLIPIVILLIEHTISAQTKLWKKFETKDGLIQYSVSTIFQDKIGYLWFGTEAGISR